MSTRGYSRQFFAEFPAATRNNISGVVPSPYFELGQLVVHLRMNVWEHFPVYSFGGGHNYTYYVAANSGHGKPRFMTALKNDDQFLVKINLDLELDHLIWFWRDPSGHFCVLGADGFRFDIMLVTVDPVTLEMTKTAIERTTQKLFHIYEGLIVKLSGSDQHQLLSCRGVEEYHGDPTTSRLCLRFGTSYLEMGMVHFREICPTE